VFDYIPFPVFTHTTGMKHFLCIKMFRVFFLDCLTLENGPDRLLRNFAN